MNAAIYCPFCLRKNEPGVTQCAHCGVSLVDADPAVLPPGQTTRRVSTRESLWLDDRALCLELPANLEVGDLVLFADRESEPIIIKKGSQITLGRYGEDASVPLFDLTPYGAINQGVSRQHAMVKVSETSCTVVDLGSTNGTWINQSRLVAGRSYPLQARDLLYLGHLKLLACIYTAEKDGEVILHLKSVAPDSKMTPQNISKILSPFLQALSEIQQVCDTCSGEESKELILLSLGTVGDTPHIMAHLSGAGGAVRLLRKRFVPWKGRLAASDGPVETSTPELQRELAKLAAEIVAELLPDQPLSQKKPFMQQLLSPLLALTKSELIFIDDQKDDS